MCLIFGVPAKKWSVAKKKALIDGDKELLVKLSKRPKIGEVDLGR